MQIDHLLVIISCGGGIIISRVRNVFALSILCLLAEKEPIVL